MHTSDSEDFESADEGGIESGQDVKGRKKSLPTHAKESDDESRQSAAASSEKSEKAPEIMDEIPDLPNDFGQMNNQPIVPTQLNPVPPKKEKPLVLKKVSPLAMEKMFGPPKIEKPQAEGWDDFDDWDENGTIVETDDTAPSEDIIVPIIQPAKTWNWGNWDNLLNTATAGISNLTTQVSQGLTTVLETGIGAPDPVELARKNADLQRKVLSEDFVQNAEAGDSPGNERVEDKSEAEASFPFGGLLSGVTKFVETTGTKVIAGGLGTLETIGKKTMEVLQDGDPGLVKKRAMLGLDAGETVVLSQVLREAKAQADEEDRLKEERREAKEVHYETLFDDFGGLVHLEALEMLSKQVSMRIEERLRSADAEKRQEIKETLQQVAELCEMPDDDDEEDSEDSLSGDALHSRLQTATQDLGLKLHFSPLVKLYTDTITALSTAPPTGKLVYKLSVSALAHYSALCTELYHRSSELLLVKGRRATADEADALALMTAVLTKHISLLANAFSDKLNSLPDENKEQINTYITNVFLEASNSSSYIQNAFQLTLPILQIGAV